jgi:hypothetical protein
MRAVLTRIRKGTGKSDFYRWKKNNELKRDWDERTALIAGLIPDSVSIIEFGAGNMTLKEHLKPDCSYTPSDLVKRCESTFVYDLNSTDLPDHDNFDYAVFSGVLEYVNDLERLARHLSTHVKFVLASYALIEHNKKNRRANGWVNDYSSTELTRIFNNAGFKLIHSARWRNQTIFLFENAAK